MLDTVFFQQYNEYNEKQKNTFGGATMTRNFNKMETLENAILDFENENEFDINDNFDMDYLGVLPTKWNTETDKVITLEDIIYHDFIVYDDYSPFEDDESWVDPEWYINGFNSEADYMHYLGEISGLS